MSKSLEHGTHIHDSTSSIQAGCHALGRPLNQKGFTAEHTEHSVARTEFPEIQGKNNSLERLGPDLTSQASTIGSCMYHMPLSHPLGQPPALPVQPHIAEDPSSLLMLASPLPWSNAGHQLRFRNLVTFHVTTLKSQSA
jgi:hypothetical protein